VRVQLDLPGNPHSSKRSLVSYNLGASAIYAVSSRFNLMLEWIGIFDQSLDVQGKRDREFEAILSPGIRYAVIDKKDFQTVIGAALPVGLNRASENYGVFMYLSLEHKLF